MHHLMSQVHAADPRQPYRTVGGPTGQAGRFVHGPDGRLYLVNATGTHEIETPQVQHFGHAGIQGAPGALSPIALSPPPSTGGSWQHSLAPMPPRHLSGGGGAGPVTGPVQHKVASGPLGLGMPFGALAATPSNNVPLQSPTPSQQAHDDYWAGYAAGQHAYQLYLWRQAAGTNTLASMLGLIAVGAHSQAWHNGFSAGWAAAQAGNTPPLAGIH